MYLTKSTIVGLEETATQQIANMVGRDIIKMLRLKGEVPLRVGDNPPLFITKDNKGLNKHTPDILNEELRIDYTESAEEGYDLALTANAPTTNFIYRDPNVKSTIKPIMSRRTMLINVSFFAKSKSKVASVISRLRSMTPAEKRSQLHDIDYFYYLPTIVIELLENINTLKNTYTVPVVDFDDYIADTFNDQATIVNSETGNPLKMSLAIREKQYSVIGSIDTDLHTLSKEKDDESGRWFFSIEYALTYELPVQLLVSYPIAVYNQPIPEKFRISPNPEAREYGHRTLDSNGLTGTTRIESPLTRIGKYGGYLKLPYADVLELPAPEAGYVRLFSAVALVDPLALTDLFYLDELPDMAFKADIIELMKLEATWMGSLFGSIFYLDIYDHRNRLYTHKVVVTPVTEDVNGVPTERIKLTTDLPLDIKGMYRVSFYVLIDLSIMYTGALSRLKTNIETVDANSVNGFSVLETVLGILDINISKLKPGIIITDNITTMDIALNVRADLWHKVFTKQTVLILTSMLDSK